MQKRTLFEISEEQANQFLELFRKLIENNKKQDEKYINLDEFCSRYRIKKSQAYQLTRENKIPGMIRNGRGIIFNIHDTDKWIESEKVHKKIV
ncbi:MAG: helix-turn-helix transcriptional regulator [Bacteroidota bacterium]